MKEIYFLLYVSDQARARAYYGEVLRLDPIVDVPGITECRLREGTVLAVMPVESARRLTGDGYFESAQATLAPKAEVYLVVKDPESFHRRALDHGGTEASPMRLRDWGHRTASSVDPDGHVLAFAEKIREADS